MKIPSKQIVNTQIADQKRHQVLEGVMIAKKVDVLRASLLELERNQKNFIEQSTIELTKATEKLHTKKIVLEREIKEAEEKLAELRKPLDEEWKQLVISQNNYEKEYTLLFDDKIKLEAREQKAKEKQEELSRQAKHNDLIQEQFIRLLDEAKAEKSDADQILSDARANRDEIKQECNERLEQVAIREEKVQFDLQANENVAQINKAKELELNKRERQINDKYATLQRTLKRKK